MIIALHLAQMRCSRREDGEEQDVHRAQARLLAVLNDPYLERRCVREKYKRL